jgi:hypothetical protein
LINGEDENLKGFWKVGNHLVMIAVKARKLREFDK